MHAIRHGRISLLQAMGVPGDLIMKRVGQTSLKINAVYTHFSDQFRKETVSRLAHPPICDNRKYHGMMYLVGPACGRVAQLGEHVLCKHGVRGSNPLTSTKIP